MVERQEAETRLVDFEVQHVDQHVIFDDSNRQIHIAFGQRLQDVL